MESKAFGDSDAFKGLLFFKTYIENGNMLLDVDGGEVASMLTMLPIHLKCGTKSVTRKVYNMLLRRMRNTEIRAEVRVLWAVRTII